MNRTASVEAGLLSQQLPPSTGVPMAELRTIIDPGARPAGHSGGLASRFRALMGPGCFDQGERCSELEG